MIFKKIKVPLFDVTVELIQLYYPDDTYEVLMKHIKSYGIDNELAEGFKDNIKRNAKNGGITCSRFNTHEIFIVFYPFSNLPKMQEVYAHEKRHTEDRILAFVGIDDRETAAYLAGKLEVQFLNFQNNVIQKCKSNS
jgi:hypothetical protein